MAAKSIALYDAGAKLPTPQIIPHLQLSFSWASQNVALFCAPSADAAAASVNSIFTLTCHMQIEETTFNMVKSLDVLI